jgi:arsenical pump membrane protein
LIGAVAGADGLFEALGAHLARRALRPRPLLLLLLALVAAVTTVLNLDTAVLFLTPVLVHAARRRGLNERPFLYGSVFMANAASLLLPGSNLTNLLVLGNRPISGAQFGTRMFPAWLAACLITAAFIALVFRVEDDAKPSEDGVPSLRFGAGAAAVLAAAILVLVLRNAALPVIAVGLVAVARRRLRPQIGARVLGLLFVVAVGLGLLARVWGGPTALLDSRGRWATAAIAGGASVLLNNLPAAVLFSAHQPPHPRALLLGLDLGPNIAVTGSLSAFLWIQAARQVGADASILTYSRLGVVLVPLTLAGSLLCLHLVSPHGI